jgi:hypothetical protein
MFGFKSRARRETEELRQKLAQMIAAHQQAMKVCVAQKQIFKTMADQDTEPLSGKKEDMTPTEYGQDLQQIADKRKRAYEAEKEGRALSVVIEVLKVIARRPNPANMIAVAEHYILEFGLGTAEISKRANETDDPDEQRNLEMEGVANQMVVITLNRFLAEIQNEHPDWYKGG